MKITHTDLPEKSILNSVGIKYDYIDSYCGEFKDLKNKISATEIGKGFFASGPDWIGKLFALRNKIVRIFGLKTAGDMTDRNMQSNNFKCEVGDRLGLFKVFYKSENEVILGEDDKHLDFRVSLFLDPQISEGGEKVLTISTTVEFHNFFGRLYFLPVKPFHRLIVPSMLKGLIQNLERTTIGES